MVFTESPPPAAARLSHGSTPLRSGFSSACERLRTTDRRDHFLLVCSGDAASQARGMGSWSPCKSDQLGEKLPAAFGQLPRANSAEPWLRTPSSADRLGCSAAWATGRAHTLALLVGPQIGEAHGRATWHRLWGCRQAHPGPRTRTPRPTDARVEKTIGACYVYFWFICVQRYYIGKTKNRT